MSVHHLSGGPSGWVVRFSALVPAGGRVLDLACGSGRHALWLAEQGFSVDAVDRDVAALRGIAGITGITAIEGDLEHGDWPLTGRQYDCIVVTNYLYRPRFAMVLAALVPSGVLIYETFMQGNERFGKPSSSEFLLRNNELLSLVGEGSRVVAFEQGEVSKPRSAMVQRICAVRGEGDPPRLP